MFGKYASKYSTQYTETFVSECNIVAKQYYVFWLYLLYIFWNISLLPCIFSEIPILIKY